MQMRNVRLRASGAKLLAHPIRDHRDPLIARNRIADLHLDVGKELIFRRPAVTMIDLHMAKGFCNYCARRRGSDPKTGSVLAHPHIIMWCKIDCAADAEVVGAA